MERLQEVEGVVLSVALPLVLGDGPVGPIRTRRRDFRSFRIRLNGHGAVVGLRKARRDLLDGRYVQELAGALVGREQRLDLAPQRRVAGAGPVQVGRPLGRVGDFQRGKKDGLFGHGEASLEDLRARGFYSQCEIRAKPGHGFSRIVARRLRRASTSRRSQARA